MDDNSLSDATPRDLSMRTMLSGIGRELDVLGADAEQIQEDLSPALMEALLENPRAMAGLQDLDRLAQVLRALGQVATRLSEVVADDRLREIRPIVAAVPLSDLGARLSAA